MLLDMQWILSFLVLGGFVGFVAGLLGVGGGGIMVPVLTTIFMYQGIAVDKEVHLALGTSMASIVVTSLASARAHNAKQAVVWNIVKVMSLGVVLGTFVATFAVVNVKPLYLALFFSLFMAYVASQMFLNKEPKANRKLAGSGGLLFAGTGIGVISALVSIGGGSLTVPFLVWQNVDIKKAIGTSAAIGFPISVAGTAGYVINGWAGTSDIEHAFGFVYIPAVLLISAVSFFTVPYGARLAHKLPVASLKKVFAVLLVLLSLKMLISLL